VHSGYLITTILQQNQHTTNAKYLNSNEEQQRTEPRRGDIYNGTAHRCTEGRITILLWQFIHPISSNALVSFQLN
jgi:hypothetical protein